MPMFSIVQSLKTTIHSLQQVIDCIHQVIENKNQLNPKELNRLRKDLFLLIVKDNLDRNHCN